MIKPIGNSDSPPTGFMGAKDADMMGKSFPIDSPWVKSLAILFPNTPIAELQFYAAKFQQNMFSALNHEIQQDEKKAKERTRKFKESIDE